MMNKITPYIVFTSKYYGLDIPKFDGTNGLVVLTMRGTSTNICQVIFVGRYIHSYVYIPKGFL